MYICIYIYVYIYIYIYVYLLLLCITTRTRSPPPPPSSGSSAGSRTSAYPGSRRQILLLLLLLLLSIIHIIIIIIIMIIIIICYDCYYYYYYYYCRPRRRRRRPPHSPTREAGPCLPGQTAEAALASLRHGPMSPMAAGCNQEGRAASTTCDCECAKCDCTTCASRRAASPTSSGTADLCIRRPGSSGAAPRGLRTSRAYASWWPLGPPGNGCSTRWTTAAWTVSKRPSPPRALPIERSWWRCARSTIRRFARSSRRSTPRERRCSVARAAVPGIPRISRSGFEPGSAGECWPERSAGAAAQRRSVAKVAPRPALRDGPSSPFVFFCGSRAPSPRAPWRGPFGAYDMRLQSNRNASLSSLRRRPPAHCAGVTASDALKRTRRTPLSGPARGVYRCLSHNTSGSAFVTAPRALRKASLPAPPNSATK